jgi:hypothetical protein
MKRIVFLFILILSANCFALQKNVASQKWVVFAFDSTDNSVKTGDAANITANLRIDGVQNAVDDTNPTELEGGYYEFGITAAESNGDNILIAASSTTGNIIVIGCPQALWTTPPYFPTMSIDSNGRLDIIKIAGTTQTANDMSGDANTLVAGVNLTSIDGQDTNGNNATLNLKQLNIVNNAGSALVASSTGNNGSGIQASGNGAGHGVFGTGGATGQGIAALGGATSGNGFYGQAQNNNDSGMRLVKDGTGVDLDAELSSDAIDNVVMSDLAAGAPSVTASIVTAINWMYSAWRNKTVTDGTNSEIVIYKDDGSTKLAESDISDDGTDFTRGEMGAPD